MTEDPEVTTEDHDHPVAAGEDLVIQGHLAETGKGQKDPVQKRDVGIKVPKIRQQRIFLALPT